jgi:DNA-binding NtrC family response regulator
LRLLRVLQEREFERVGDSVPIRADVRVVAATNQDLAKKIKAGEFRQDLYYRLNVVKIDVPPLRERREDIPLLVDYFCGRLNALLRRNIQGLAPETMDVFMDFPWLGNIRELENCMERAFIVCREPYVLPRHLPAEILDGRGALFVEHQSGSVPFSGNIAKDHIVEVLTQTDWNVAKSARQLGIARNTLYQKIKLHGLSRPSTR